MRYLLVAVLAVGCGDNAAAPPDAAGHVDAAPIPPPTPQMLTCCHESNIDYARECLQSMTNAPNVCNAVACPVDPLSPVLGGTTIDFCSANFCCSDEPDWGSVASCAAATLPAGQCGVMVCAVDLGIVHEVKVCGEN